MAEADTTTNPVEAVQAEEKPTDNVAAEPTEVAETEKPEKPEKPEEKAEDKSENKSEDKTEQKKQDGAGKATLLKTRAKINLDDLSKNRKFDPSTREVTDDPESIRKQVEFYFGDWNFPQDKFMWETCGGSDNNPMAIEKIHSFKRMRTFQPYSAVVAALRESDLLVVSGEEGNEMVRRKSPYKSMPTAKAKAEAATAYVKGFGDEKPDTQFDLESFFANFGEVKGLKLRRTPENLFKGSVFVTFADEETTKKFVELDPSPKWKDHELKVMTKHAYCEEKNQLIRQGKLEPTKTVPKKFYEGKDPSSRGGPRDRRDHDQDDWKKRRDHDQKNGFRDRGSRGSRGSGRGRGGRGRGNRDFGRNQERDQDHEKHSVNDAKPRIQSTDEPASKDAEGTNGKRAREDDGPTEAPAAKKADTKVGEGKAA